MTKQDVTQCFKAAQVKSTHTIPQLANQYNPAESVPDEHARMASIYARSRIEEPRH